MFHQLFIKIAFHQEQKRSFHQVFIRLFVSFIIGPCQAWPGFHHMFSRFYYHIQQRSTGFHRLKVSIRFHQFSSVLIRCSTFFHQFTILSVRLVIKTLQASSCFHQFVIRFFIRSNSVHQVSFSFHQAPSSFISFHQLRSRV